MNTSLNLTSLGLAALLCMTTLAACSQKPSEESAAKPSQSSASDTPRKTEHIRLPVASAKPVCANCGVVLAVNVVDVEVKGSGAGVVAGGVVGGLVGNQVGQGQGRDLATFAGVVGGAIAGNAIEKKSRSTKSYAITVQMDDGTERTYRQATDPGMVKGQKVRIENDVVVKN